MLWPCHPRAFLQPFHACIPALWGSIKKQQDNEQAAADYCAACCMLVQHYNKNSQCHHKLAFNACKLTQIILLIDKFKNMNHWYVGKTTGRVKLSCKRILYGQFREGLRYADLCASQRSSEGASITGRGVDHFWRRWSINGTVYRSLATSRAILW